MLFGLLYKPLLTSLLLSFFLNCMCKKLYVEKIKQTFKMFSVLPETTGVSGIGLTW